MEETFCQQFFSSKNFLETTEEINKAETLLLFSWRRKKDEGRGERRRLKEIKRQIYISQVRDCF